MAFRKSPPSLPARGNARNGGHRVSVGALLLVSVVAPLFILATRSTSFLSPGMASFWNTGLAGFSDTCRVLEELSVVDSVCELLSLCMATLHAVRNDLVVRFDS